jgi:hypothetical protein
MSGKFERLVNHPAYGFGTVISVRVNEAGCRIAICRFDSPPGMVKGERGMKPVAEVVFNQRGAQWLRM